MSTKEQVGNLKAIADVTSNLTFQFVDWIDMPKRLDKMDNVRARFEYYEKGLEDGKTIDCKLFKV
jgi:hypothetical protein